MKLITIVGAKEALTRLTEKHFTNFKVARKLVTLRKAVDAEVEFYAEEEKKAVDLYAEKDENGNPVFLGEGRLKLKNNEAKLAFESEVKKLLDTEVDDIEPVLLRESDFRSADDLPTPGDMIALACLRLDDMKEFYSE